jgi:RNA polymerase sigma-70 factor, ECF subfamily
MDASFDRYYETSFARLVDRVEERLGDRRTAHACVQQAFVHAWARRERFAAAADPDAWVCERATRLAGRHRPPPWRNLAVTLQG